jgi:hypothetical protein
MRHAEGHVGLLGLHTELVKQAAEQGIGGVIEDHEARVDGDLTAIFIGTVDRIRVPADVARGLEDRQIKLPMQKVSAAKAGDASSDDGETGAGHSRD